MRPIYIADDSSDQRYLFGYFLKRVNPDYPVISFDRAQPMLDALSLVLKTGEILTDGGFSGFANARCGWF